MSRQTKLIHGQCQERLRRGESGRCVHDATHGIYAWDAAATDVNLDHPVRIVCGAHKPHFDYRRRHQLRIVKLKRRAE